MKLHQVRTIIKILAMIVLISITISSHSLAVEDLTAPALEKVELGTTELNAGDSNSIYITPNDDISGVKYVFFHAESPSGNQSYGANIYSVDEQGRWYGTIPINANAEGGTWKIDMIALTDHAGNTKYYHSGQDFTAEFSVTSPNADSSAPSLENVELSKAEINAGESNTVFITPKDDISGVKYVFFHAESPSGNQSYGANIYSIDEQGRWYGTIPTNTNSEGGTWKIDMIALTDHAGNTKYYHYGQDFTTDFSVTNQNADISAPSLENVELSKVEIKAEESNTIYITPKDDISGVKYVFFHAESPSGDQSYGANIYSVDEQGRWYGTIPTNANSEGGTWKIDMIALTDHAGNTKYYHYEQDFTADFYVNSGNDHVDSVTLSVDHTGPEEIGTPIKLTANSEGSDRPEYRFFIRDEKGVLTTIQEYGEMNSATWTPTIPGTYKLIVHAKDQSGTGTENYYEARADMSFKVEGSKVTGVKLNTVTASPQQVGSSIKLTAAAEGGTNPDYRFFVRDEEGILTTIQEYGNGSNVTWTPTEPGTYKIIVHAKDKSRTGPGNYYEARTDMSFKVEGIKVTGVHVNADVVSPQIIGNSIKLTASAEGGTNPDYRFLVRDEKGTLTTIQEYGNGSNASWTPKEPGIYKIIVHAKDSSRTGSGNYYEARTEMKFMIEGIKVTGVQINSDRASPQLHGHPIKLTATAEGGTNPDYRFLVRDEKGILTTIQDYGNGSSAIWTPTNPGTYKIIVHAKDRSRTGQGNYYESRNELRFIIE